jgi:hypothetical protein
MAGRMGNKIRSQKNCLVTKFFFYSHLLVESHHSHCSQVYELWPQLDVMMVLGPVPGPKGGWLEITDAFLHKFETPPPFPTFVPPPTETEVPEQLTHLMPHPHKFVLNHLGATPSKIEVANPKFTMATPEEAAKLWKEEYWPDEIEEWEKRVLKKKNLMKVGRRVRSEFKIYKRSTDVPAERGSLDDNLY